MIDKENSVLDLEYDRIKNKVTVKYVTNEGEVLDVVEKEVFYFDEFTPEKKEFSYTEYLDGIETVQIKGDREITVNYKRLLADGVRLVYKHGDDVVKQEMVVEAGQKIGSTYKVKLPDNGQITVGDKVYVIDTHVSGDLEGTLNGGTIDVVYSVKEVTHTTDTQTEDLAFETEYIDDDTLDVGREVVEVVGVDGLKTTTYDVVNHDGVEVRRNKVNEEVKNPVNRVIRRGTKIAPEETSGVVVMKYEHKGDVIKDTVLLPAGSPLGSKFESHLEKGDIIKIKDKQYIVDEIKGELKGQGTKDSQEITVKVKEYEEKEDKYNLTIPFDTEQRYDDTIPYGETRVETEGVEGITEITKKIILIDGVETETKVIDIKEVSKPVTKVVLVGSKDASGDLPDLVNDKPNKPEIPTVDDGVKKLHKTRWIIKGEDGKDIDLVDEITSKEYKEKLEIQGYHLVDTKEDKEENIKTYIYEKDKVVEPEKPEKPVVPTKPEEENPDETHGKKPTQDDVVPQVIVNAPVDGVANGRVVTPGSKGSLSKTGLENSSVGLAVGGLLTVALGLFAYRCKYNKED